MRFSYNYPADWNSYISPHAYEEFEQQFQQIWPTLMRVGIGVVILIGILALLFYVFFSLSIYTMAERRGLSGSFFAWVPFLRWGTAGRVASDSHELRTGNKAFYGTFLLLLMLFPALVGIALTITDLPLWVHLLSILLLAALSVLKLFALSEIYRDYSKHWVGMLIFSMLCDVLVPIFLIAIHKNIPVSAQRRPHIEEPAAPQAPEEPIVTPPPAQTSDEPEPLAPEEDAPAESDDFGEADEPAGEPIVTPPMLDAEAVEEVEALLKDTAETVSQD